MMNDALIEKQDKVFDFLVKEINQCIQEKGSCILAIEGRAAAGKTTLATILQKTFEAAVIHMDDFFLPLELRTKVRYDTPGGNIHYERFNQEVARALRQKEAFQYQRFNCKKMQLDTWQDVENKQVIIIEGTYAMHPEVRVSYDLKVFLDIEQKEQEDRILYRNGVERLEQFLKTWIPLEEKYFESYSIRQGSDIVLK